MDWIDLEDFLFIRWTFPIFFVREINIDIICSFVVSLNWCRLKETSDYLFNENSAECLKVFIENLPYSIRLRFNVTLIFKSAKISTT